MLLSILLALPIAHHPLQEERVVRRSFSTELELSTESFDIEASEEGKRAAQQGPHYTREEAYDVEVTDTLLGDEDPPAKFTRHYDTVMNSLRLSGAKSPLEKTGSAGLEGKTVTFERDEKGRYERSCDDAEVRPVQLNRLRLDLSLARFLASGDEEAPESWTLPFAEFQRLLAPLEERPRRAHAKAAATADGSLKRRPMLTLNATISAVPAT